MQLEILSPEKKIFSGDAELVEFPGTTGSFQVMQRHAPMIASLKKGDIVVKSGKESWKFAISGGFVEVLQHKVSVLVEEAPAP